MAVAGEVLAVLGRLAGHETSVAARLGLAHGTPEAARVALEALLHTMPEATVRGLMHAAPAAIEGAMRVSLNAAVHNAGRVGWSLGTRQFMNGAGHFLATPLRHPGATIAIGTVTVAGALAMPVLRSYRDEWQRAADEPSRRRIADRAQVLAQALTEPGLIPDAQPNGTPIPEVQRRQEAERLLAEHIRIAGGPSQEETAIQTFIPALRALRRREQQYEAGQAGDVPPTFAQVSAETIARGGSGNNFLDKILNNLGSPGTIIGALGGGVAGYLLGGGWMAAVGAAAGGLGGALIASNAENAPVRPQTRGGATRGGGRATGKELSDDLAQAMGQQQQGLVPSYTPSVPQTGAEAGLPVT